jgi:hypothetical protein
MYISRIALYLIYTQRSNQFFNKYKKYKIQINKQILKNGITILTITRNIIAICLNKSAPGTCEHFEPIV